MSKSKSSTSGLRRERTIFEWTLLAVSIAAIGAIVVGLVAFGLSARSGPPSLRVSVRPAGGTDVVLVVDNQGGTTAEDVIVEVKRGEEMREVEFRAVPKGDYEEAIVPLPGTGPATAEVMSYKEP